MTIEHVLVDFKSDDRIRQDEAELILVEIASSIGDLDYERKNKRFSWSSPQDDIRRLARTYVITVAPERASDVAMLLRDSPLVHQAYLGKA